MKANHQKAELLKCYVLMAAVIFPLLFFQSWLASDASKNKFNIISLNSFSIIVFYSICFLGLLFEEKQIKSAIRTIIYCSAGAITPYIFFFNASIMFLYTKPSEIDISNKSLILTFIINFIFGFVSIINTRKETSTKNLITKEFKIDKHIIMNNPYKKDYWQKTKKFPYPFIPIILSLTPFILFLIYTRQKFSFDIYIMSILGAPLSMCGFLILVKSIYIYFYIPVYLGFREGKKVIFNSVQGK